MAATAKKEDKERNLVTEAAKRALEDADGDVAKATRMMEDAVKSSRSLRDALTEPLIKLACYDAVRSASADQRRKSWKPPTEQWVPGKVTGSGRVVQLSKATLLMFPLPGGKALQDAKASDLSAAQSFYQGQSADMAHKARWLQLVAQSIPDGKTVGEVLSDKRLRELQEEARNG